MLPPLFFHRCARHPPADPPARRPVARIDEKIKTGCSPWPYMAKIWPIHGQKLTKNKKQNGQKLAIYTAYILPIYSLLLVSVCIQRVDCINNNKRSLYTRPGLVWSGLARSGQARRCCAAGETDTAPAPPIGSWAPVRQPARRRGLFLRTPAAVGRGRAAGARRDAMRGGVRIAAPPLSLRKPPRRPRWTINAKG